MLAAAPLLVSLFIAFKIRHVHDSFSENRAMFMALFAITIAVLLNVMLILTAADQHLLVGLIYSSGLCSFNLRAYHPFAPMADILRTEPVNSHGFLLFGWMFRSS